MVKTFRKYEHLDSPLEMADLFFFCGDWSAEGGGIAILWLDLCSIFFIYFVFQFVLVIFVYILHFQLVRIIYFLSRVMHTFVYFIFLFVLLWICTRFCCCIFVYIFTICIVYFCIFSIFTCIIHLCIFHIFTCIVDFFTGHFPHCMNVHPYFLYICVYIYKLYCIFLYILYFYLYRIFLYILYFCLYCIFLYFVSGHFPLAMNVHPTAKQDFWGFRKLWWDTMAQSFQILKVQNVTFQTLRIGEKKITRVFRFLENCAET